MAVHVTGAVLASLFYDTVQSAGDQIGFLLGEVVSHVKDVISDSQIQNSEVETKTYVYGHVPCPRDQKFYDNRGQVLERKVLDLLKSKHKNIVGWYSFRRNSSMRPSYREQILHANLAQAISDEPLSEFLLFLFSCKPTTNLSTHTTDHGLLHLSDSGFKKVSMNVVNLGVTTHTEYRHHPTHTVSLSGGAYSDLIQKHEKQFLDAQGHVHLKPINTLASSLHKQLQELSVGVLKSEATVSQLETEVMTLRKQVKVKQMEALQKTKKKVSNSKTSIALEHSLGNDDVLHSVGDSKEKQPSIDDLLSMDYTDNDVQTETASPNPLYNMSNMVKDQFNVKAPSSLATTDIPRSASPVDSSWDKEQVKTHIPIPPWSDNEPQKKRQSDSESVSGKLNTKTRQTDDPFSFVSSMMAGSKQGQTFSSETLTKSGSMELKKGEHIKLPSAKEGPDNLGKTGDRTPDSSNLSARKDTLRKSSRENTIAAAATAAAASSVAGSNVKSERLRGRKGHGKSDVNSSSVLHTSGEEDNQLGSAKGSVSVSKTARSGTIPGSGTSNNITRCSQEISKNKLGDSCKPSEDANSTDGSSFEEMEVTSSPVY